ncbi:MAG TPA: hypothetical protein VGC14_16095, partial [Rhizobium sp.]
SLINYSVNAVVVAAQVNKKSTVYHQKSYDGRIIYSQLVDGWNRATTRKPCVSSPSIFTGSGTTRQMASCRCHL